MENKKFWIGLISILIIINLITLSFIALKSGNISHRAPNHHEMDHERLNHYLGDKLNLDKEQILLFKEERRDHFSKLSPLERKLRDAKHNLMEKNMNESSIQDVEQELNEIANLNRQIDSLAYIHFAKLRSFCKEDQKEDFDVMLKGMLDNKMGDRPRPERRNRPR